MSEILSRNKSQSPDKGSLQPQNQVNCTHLNDIRNLPKTWLRTVLPSSPWHAFLASNGFVNWTNAYPLCIEIPVNEKLKVFLVFFMILNCEYTIICRWDEFNRFNFGAEKLSTANIDQMWKSHSLRRWEMKNRWMKIPRMLNYSIKPFINKLSMWNSLAILLILTKNSEKYLEHSSTRHTIKERKSSATTAKHEFVTPIYIFELREQLILLSQFTIMIHTSRQMIYSCFKFENINKNDDVNRY